MSYKLIEYRTTLDVWLGCLGVHIAAWDQNAFYSFSISHGFTGMLEYYLVDCFTISPLVPGYELFGAEESRWKLPNELFEIHVKRSRRARFSYEIVVFAECEALVAFR